MVRWTQTLRFVLALACMLIAHAAIAGSYPDISILEESPAGMTFVYTPGPLHWVEEPDGICPRIAHTALQRAEGRPPIPGRIVYVALPPGSRSVDAVLTDYAAEVRATQEGLSFTDAAARAAADAVYPHDRLLIDGIFTLRGLRLARLILHPLVVIPAERQSSFLPSMTVTVRFDRTARRAPETVMPAARRTSATFDHILGEVVLNAAAGRQWRTDLAALRRPSGAVPHPFAGADRWYAVRTRGDGVVAMTAADLAAAGIDLGSADPRRFRVFAGEGKHLSTRMVDPAPAFQEAAIRIVGEDDGIFDNNDTLCFWAEGLNRWEVGPDGTLVDLVHRYDRDNVYWFVPDGTFAEAPRRIATQPSLPPDESELTVFSSPERLRREEELIFRTGSLGYVESYYTWYWRNQQTSTLSLYGVVNVEPGSSAELVIASFAGVSGRDPALLRVDDDVIAPSSFRPWAGEDRMTFTSFDLPEFDPGSHYTLEFSSSGGTTEATNFYLDHYGLAYHRQLDLSQGPQKFVAPDTGAVATFVVANAADAVVWDITDPYTPVQISGLASTGSVSRFALALSPGRRTVFYARHPTSIVRPQSISAVTPADLHASSSGVDFLLIGPREFEVATDPFRALRAASDNLSMRYIALEDINNSFAGGCTDPVAIRRFLRHTFFEWPEPAPTYVLLVGDGSHDFLDHLNTGAINHVPPYITVEDDVVSDERFVYFSDSDVLNAVPEENDPFPDMIIGRWPVRTASEIQALTEKIAGYESSDNLGPWRSRVMIVADDEFGDRSSSPPSVREVVHINDAEAIAHHVVPARFDLNKIYLTEYPFDNPSCYNAGARGCRKPAAGEAIVAGLNGGAAVFDYIGHGNMDLLAHERVFERATDLPRLTNVGMPTAVLTFSCSIGFFDHPSRESMAEEWLRMPVGGAVAVVAATRLSRATANAELNEEVFDLLFNRGMERIGAAVYTAKLLRQYHDPTCALLSGCPDGPPCPCDNDRGYMILGDPTMRLGIPTLNVAFESVTPESLAALQLTRVAGSITSATGVRQSDFDGSVFVTVRDVPRRRLYRVTDVDSLVYDLSGGTLYRGWSVVTGGRFEFSFVVPKDIAYGERGARILGHAVGGDRMAAGAVDSLWIAAEAGDLTDTLGPLLRLVTAADEPVVDGFRIAAGSELTLVLEDPSGINLTGAPGHRLLVTVGDGDEPLVDLTESFVYDPGSAERGQATFSLAGLLLGPIRLDVRAWDNANNSSALTVDVELTDEDDATDFEIVEFMGYPNPLDERTTFYFSATRAIEQATIRIFTVAGRLIWESGQARAGELSWDGSDRVGDQVANGVYLAQIEAIGRVATGGGMVDKKAYRETKLVISR